MRVYQSLREKLVQSLYLHPLHSVIPLRGELIQTLLINPECRGLLLETIKDNHKSSSSLGVFKRLDLQLAMNLHYQIAEKKNDQDNLLLARVRRLDTKTITYIRGCLTCFLWQLSFQWNQRIWRDLVLVFSSKVWGALFVKPRQLPFQEGTPLIAYSNKSYCIY